MSSLRTLLAATDLSAPSRHAVARAAMIARDTGARLELLHVIQAGALDHLRHLLGEDEEAQAALPRLEDEARQALARIAREVCEAHGVNPGTHLAHGPVLEVIASQADALDADLLVLGARGSGFMHHALLGSTADRMLRKTLRSLLIVKQLPHEGYRRVLVAVDFSAYALRAIRLAGALAPQADLILLHALNDDLEGTLRYAGVEETKIIRYRMEARQEALRNVERLAREAGLDAARVHRLVLAGHPSTCILEQEEERDVDLIVLGKHGEGMVEELLLGSTTKHVLAGSRVDVLVAR